MVEAYRRIFDRCGLDYLVVEADPGTIGGDVNHEFMARAEVGEDLYVTCENGDYTANIEAASLRPPDEPPPGELEPLTEVATPGRPGIQDVVELLGRPASDLLKCMLYDAGGAPVAVLIRGDREVNETKLERALWPAPVRRFTDEDFAVHGLVKGYVGPQGLPPEVTIVADHSVRGGRNWVTGANKLDHHVTGANLGRDFRVDRWEDLSQVGEGDPCPRDGGTLHIGRSIVVGHTYQLGTRYSKPLKATFVDEDGTEELYHMGCYGIGLSRIVAAAAEQWYDDAGLRWPKALAPFDVVIIPSNMDQPAVVEAAERLYADIANASLRVLIDDRDVTAGVKFADADLIGHPLQVVVGKRGIQSGTVDLKVRCTGARSSVAMAETIPAVVDLLAAAP